MENPFTNIDNPATEVNAITVGWFDRFVKNKDAVYGFVSLIVILVMGYIIKDNYASQIVKKDIEYAVLKREKFVSDSTYQLRLDRVNYLSQDRIDRLQTSKDSILILYGVKKGLEK